MLFSAPVSLPPRKLRRASAALLTCLLLGLGGRPAAGQNLDSQTKQIWQAYQAQKFETVIEQGRRIIAERKTGDALMIRLAVGRALVVTGQHASALPHLRKVATSEGPDHARAWALNFLGKAHYRLGHLEESKAAFHRSRDMQATENSTRSSQRWMYTLGFDEMYESWTQVETQHLRIFASPKLGISRNRLEQRYESAYRAMAGFFADTLDRDIRLFLWASASEAKQVGIEVGFARPDLFLIHAEIGQTPGHELAHVFEDQVLSPSYQAGLISEGVAVYLDQTNRNRLETARQAVRTTDGQVSIQDWWQRSPEEWTQIPSRVRYPVAGAFVAHLAERGGKERLLQLLQNQRLEEAQAVYGPDTLSRWITSFEALLEKEGLEKEGNGGGR